MPFITSNITENASAKPEEFAQEMLENDKSMPIAIVGIACRFPGDAVNPDKLWELCAKKEAAWSEIPKERMNIDSYYHPDGERAGNVCLPLVYFWKTPR